MTTSPDTPDASESADSSGVTRRPASASSTGGSTGSADSSGNLDRPAGPLSSRVSTAQRTADSTSRAEMPLAPKEPSKKLKRGDTGYRRVKKVKPISPQRGTGDEARPRSKSMLVLIALLLISAVLALYINSSETPVAEESMVLALDGDTFQATAAFGLTLPEASALTLSFSGALSDVGALGVSGGCNQISGSYRLVGGYADTASYGGTLESVDGWSQTEMACDQPLMDLDAAVVDMLNSTPRLTLVGATLTMTVNDPELALRSITFERLP